MEHKGIKYTILARPGRYEWAWTVYLDGNKTKQGNVLSYCHDPIPRGEYRRTVRRLSRVRKKTRR